MVAPHNWGSLVGYYMQLHVGRAIENFYRAEHDPLSPALFAEKVAGVREAIVLSADGLRWAFVSYMIGGDVPDGLPTARDGVRSARIIDAVLESAKTRSWQEVMS